MTYKRRSDLSDDHLREIFQRLKLERPVLANRLLENEFEDIDEKARHIGGMTFFVGVHLGFFDNPLSLEASNISHDILNILIRPKWGDT